MDDVFFFFSSRRRHTRSYGDWSSDVCSSDLRQTFASVPGATRPVNPRRKAATGSSKIGRASCRESVDLGGRRIIKKKKKTKGKKEKIREVNGRINIKTEMDENIYI